MTKKELLEALKDMPDDEVVYIRHREDGAICDGFGRVTGAEGTIAYRIPGLKGFASKRWHRDSIETYLWSISFDW